jgi:hypothetical protein
MLTKVTTITPVEVWMRLKDADLLKGQMRVQGHTTRSLAEAVECSRGFIGDLCRGAKNQCSPNLAHKIAASWRRKSDSFFSSSRLRILGKTQKQSWRRRKTARRVGARHDRKISYAASPVGTRRSQRAVVAAVYGGETGSNRSSTGSTDGPLRAGSRPGRPAGPRRARRSR